MNRNQNNIRESNKNHRDTSAVGSAVGGGTRYDAPCRYWRFGTCKMAEHCRFSHTETPDEQSDNNYGGHLRLSHSVDSDLSLTSSNSSLICEDYSQLNEDLQRMRLSRRPFVHVIVLYAGGIGVLTIPPSGNVDGKVSSFAREVCARFAESSIDHLFHCKLDSIHFIRTENLSEIIGHSKSDHLVVIGDRNMKNRTIQVRRRAKLVEMTVEEAICFIWSEVEFQREEDLETQLGTNELYNLIDKYCGVRHYKERVDRLRCDMEELDRLSTTEPWTTDASGHSVMSERAQFKLTQVQRSLIRMHQQLHEATDRLEAEEENEISRRGTEICDSGHNPTSHPIIGICQDIHYKLYEFSAKLLYALENGLVRRRMKDYLNTMVLWNSYQQEYTNGEVEEDFWRCEACTLVNTTVTNICDVCQCPRDTSVVDPGEGGWLEAGRSRRKMKRQQHRQDRTVSIPKALILRASADSAPDRSQHHAISPPQHRERSLSSSSINNRWAHPPAIVPETTRRMRLENPRRAVEIVPKPVGRALSLETINRSGQENSQNSGRSLPVSPSKTLGVSFFSDLWSDSSRSVSYSSLPSTAFEFVPHHLELFSHHDVPQSDSTMATPEVPREAQANLIFEEPEEELEIYEAQRPCLCCGEESFMECTFCVRANLPPAFFLFCRTPSQDVETALSTTPIATSHPKKFREYSATHSTTLPLQRAR